MLPRLAPLVLTEGPLQSWTDPNDINSLLAEGDYLWAATSGGLVRWHLPTGKYLVYTTREGLASQAIRGLAQDADGHIWVGYMDYGSWSEYDGQRWHLWESRDAAVNARYQAMLHARHFDARMWSSRAGGAWLWFPSGEGQVAAYDGRDWQAYGEIEGVRHDTWLVAVSAQGRVWAVGESLSTAEEGDSWWQDHSFYAGVPGDSQVTDVALDDQGGIWLAFSSPSRPGGLGRLDPNANRWTGYDHILNPMIPRQVHCVQIDAEGTIWLGGEHGIAFRGPSGRWQSIPLANITAQSMVRDREGRFWVGTAHGLWSIAADGTDQRGPWLVPSPLLGNQVLALAQDGQGRLWIGTSKGVTYVDGAAAIRGAANSGGDNTGILADEPVLCLATGPANDIWLATRSGLDVVRNDRTRERLLDDVVYAIAFDPSGMPWVCTESGEIKKRSDAGWQMVARIVALALSPARRMVVGRDGSIWLATTAGLGVWSAEGQFSLLKAEGLPEGEVRGLALGQDGALWVATARGLSRRSPSGQWGVLTTASTQGGLRSAEIRDVLLDREGTLWVSTAAGISVRSAKADWSYLDLPGVRSVWPEPSGIVWLGTSGGLYRLQRDALMAVP